MKLEPLSSYTWPTDCVPLASIDVRVDDLAARIGVSVHAWDVDGLGPARGFGVRLPSGQVILLEELELAIRHQRAKGPILYVDAAELARLGPELLAAEVLGILQLSLSDLAWVADLAARQNAVELAAWALAFKAKCESLGEAQGG